VLESGPASPTDALDAPASLLLTGAELADADGGAAPFSAFSIAPVEPASVDETSSATGGRAQLA
jgi:hypothetical protein